MKTLWKITTKPTSIKRTKNKTNLNVNKYLWILSFPITHNAHTCKPFLFEYMRCDDTPSVYKQMHHYRCHTRNIRFLIKFFTPKFYSTANWNESISSNAISNSNLQKKKKKKLYSSIVLSVEHENPFFCVQILSIYRCLCNAAMLRCCDAAMCNDVT